MKFLIKEISTSRKEIRIQLIPNKINQTTFYQFGESDSNFDEGSIGLESIPFELSKFTSIGPNPAHIRVLVAYLKDTLTTPSGITNTLLLTKNDVYIPIVNIVVDDISLYKLSSDTIPSIIIKLLNPIPATEQKLDEISIQKQILSTQEQEVYYISANEPPSIIRGLDYDIGMLEEIGDPQLRKIEFNNYNELTSSFKQKDLSNIQSQLSGSVNLKIDYNNFSNHTHFGSAVSKLENFKSKLSTIENHLLIISQSLITSSLSSVNDARKNKFNEISKIQSTFTDYEKSLYYKSDKLNYTYNVNLGQNYTKLKPIVATNSEILLNTYGMNLVTKVSGSETISNIPLFSSLYNVENKPFYNHSGSFYLSFLMKGDETIKNSNVNNIVWKNDQENHLPKLPHDTLYTSSILEPNIKSGSWRRYIYEASSSYWAPHSSNPIIGYPGTITDFSAGSSEVVLYSGNKSGSHRITAGGRYSNIASYVTSSGVSFSGSISPAGELFNITINTNYGANITSSYIADVKINKYNPLNSLPFSEVYSTSSVEFTNWYNDMHLSASIFDRDNQHSFIKTLPSYLQDDNQMNNVEFRNYVHMMGEQYDITKNYIDGYTSIWKNQYGEVGTVPDNLLPVLSQNYNWNLDLPISNKEDADFLNFFGSSLSDVNSTSNVTNNIWRNIINNIRYMYKTKGTQNSIRALLNSYGFPPDILKIREHGASMDKFEDSILSDDITNVKDGLGEESGNVSFTKKEDKLVSYVVDSYNRRLGLDWRRNDAFGEVVEFTIKPKKSTTTQILLNSSGSLDSGSLWDITLEQSASSNTKARLQFRLNNTNDASGSIETIANRVSMSTDYFDIKNQNFWNVLLQRVAGPVDPLETFRGYSASFNNANSPFNDVLLLMSHSYEMYIGESVSDKLRVFSKVSMSIGGDGNKYAADNWIGTGSRHTNSGSNLVIGTDYTGSIAEIRTWKNPLSASVFKQHIYDKKSTVGNSLEDSRTNLIYHYRLNENWLSGSSSQKIKDSNPNNIKDYSIDFTDVMTGSLYNRPLYESVTYDRIQFNVGIGGAYELSDNNIIVDADRRFIDQLNPSGPSVMNVYHPLINKRKASSTLEITRSPQEVINDFILNQLGNFDFNDKFADPQDINKATYEDLEKFSKEFFDYYEISLDVNKFIKAQATLFSKDLIKSLKKLVPVRANFSKIGVELKPTLLERQKIQNSKLEQQILDFKGDIVYSDTNKNISDWENNTFLGKTLVKGIPVNLSKDVHIEYSSITGSKYHTFENELRVPQKMGLRFSTVSGSKYYKFQTIQQLTKNSHIQYSTPSGSSYYSFTNEYNKSYDANIEIQSITGSKDYFDFTKLEPLYKTNDTSFIFDKSGVNNLNLTDKYEVTETKNSTINVSSEGTGSLYKFTKLEPLHKTKDINFSVASSTGSISYDFTKLEPLYTTKDVHMEVASSTGSMYNLSKLEPLYTSNDGHIQISSPTGSVLLFDKLQPLYTTKDVSFSIASSTGSIVKDFTKLEPLYTTKDVHIEISSGTGSVYNLTDYEPLYTTKDVSFDVASSAGSITYDFTKLESLYKTLNKEFSIASATGSLSYNFSKLEPIFSTKDVSFSIASSAGSISWDFTKLEPLYTTKDAHIEIASGTGSVYNINKLEPLYTTDNGNLDISFTNKTGSKSLSLTNNYEHYKDSKIEIASSTSSNPTVSSTLFVPYEGTFKYLGDTTLYEKVNESYKDFEKDWGHGVNDVYFIHFGNPGKDGNYNTYHYEKRYLFHAFGDVESISGSVATSAASFETDYTGTITAGVYTASKDFNNKALVKINDFSGLKSLGTTIEFKPSSSIDIGGGKFLDEIFVYPANHIFLVGSSKDSLSRLTYKGTQNKGGDIIESQAFTDLSDDAFYHILTTGAQGYTVDSDY